MSAQTISPQKGAELGAVCRGFAASALFQVPFAEKPFPRRYRKIHKIKRKIAKLPHPFRCDVSLSSTPPQRGSPRKASPVFRAVGYFYLVKKRKICHNGYKPGEIRQKPPCKFSTFAERNFQKARNIKSKTTNPLCPKGKTSIVEPEEYTALRARPVCPGWV